ncbi:MAG: DUF302 domain-containing protein [Pseudomonadota bacterium]|nr:DUF302 domain-containing protein [Pseudomonadota bacterium]
MYRVLFLLLATLLYLPLVNADNGLIKAKSPYTVDETLDRFEAAVTNKGMTIFTRIDHAAGAAKVGKELPPTVVLVFGNPAIGSLLMQSKQTVAIDLPLKLLVWEDDSGQVWITYNDPDYLVKRHAITDRAPVVEKMRKAMSDFTAAAIAK